MSRMSLTTSQRKTLANNETVIGQGLATFVDVGRALASIQDGKLYAGEFESFVEYCHERWDITDRHARRMMLGSAVVQRIQAGPIGPVLPATESQARPLTTIAVEKVGDVWQAVVEQAELDVDGKPRITAALVQREVDRFNEAAKPAADENADLPETLQSTTGDDAPAAELADEDTLCSACGCYDCGCDSEPNPAIEAADDVPDDPLAELTDDDLEKVDRLFDDFRAFISGLGLGDDVTAVAWRELAKRIERYAIVMGDAD